MSEFFLRRASIEDSSLLSEISETTFREAYSDQCGGDDMDIFVRQAFSSSTIEGELQKEEMRYFILECELKTAGYVFIKFNSSPENISVITPSLEIKRFYLRKEFYGSGGSQFMMQKIFSLAEENGMKSCWLTVWDLNPRAVRFYEKCGFKIAGTMLFKMGNRIDEDWVMVRNL